MSNQDGAWTRAALRERHDRLRRAVELAERGETGAARREATQILNEDPEYGPALALLAQLGQEAGEAVGRDADRRVPATMSRVAGPDPVCATQNEYLRAAEASVTSSPVARSPEQDVAPTLPGTSVSTSSWTQFQRRMQLRRETTCVTAMRQAMQAGDYRTALERARELMTMDPGWQEVALFLEQLQAQAASPDTTPTVGDRAEQMNFARSKTAGSGAAHRAPATVTGTSPTAGARTSGARPARSSAASTPPTPSVRTATVSVRRQDAAVRTLATAPRSRLRTGALVVLVIILTAAAIGWLSVGFLPPTLVARWADFLQWPQQRVPSPAQPRSGQSQPQATAGGPELPFAGIVPPAGGNLVEVPNEDAPSQEATGGALQSSPGTPGTKTDSPAPAADGAGRQTASDRVAAPTEPSSATKSARAITPQQTNDSGRGARPSASEDNTTALLNRAASQGAATTDQSRPATDQGPVTGPRDRGLTNRDQVAAVPGLPAPEPVPPQTVPQLPPQSASGSTDLSSAGAAAGTTGAASAATPRATTGSDADAEDRGRIAKTIGAYAQAYTSLNAAAVRRVWPGVNEDALRNAFEQLESQRVAFSGCMVAVSDLHATATCRGTATYVPKVGGQERITGSHEWRFALRKVVNTWVIDSASIR